MKSSIRVIISLLLLFIVLYSVATAQQITLLQQGKPASIRGLSVVDDSVAWISGSKGYVALTHDGGKNWAWQQVKGFEKADFRDIEAFSDKEAVIMSSGTPALVLKTTDGGANWQVKYSNADTTYFFDAMDFADRKHGYILGDPINNKFLLMETEDGGDTWNMFKYRPDAFTNEAAFAASGTCLRVNKKSITIVSGGSQTREIRYLMNGEKWDYRPLPITHGKASQGTFSFAESGNSAAKVFVGGDYANDHKIDSIASYIRRYDNYFKLPEQSPIGFQSCVEFISGEIFLSTGTPGSNITTNGGKTWAKIDGTSYNVCRKAKHGKLVLLAGNGGKIGVLHL